jgi:hypothetical protein
MNWQAIGAIGEILGALGVFISLLYLATQIRSSRRSDQMIAVADAGSAVDQWIGQLVRDENLFDLYRRGLTDYESLGREEKGRFAMLILQFLRRLEAVWHHRQLVTIDTGYWQSLEAVIFKVIGTVGGRRGFQKHADTLTPEFAALVESILDRRMSEERAVRDVDNGTEESTTDATR